MASDAYRRSAAASRAAAERSRTPSIGRLLASLGPWLVVYAVFLASAIATAAFTVSQAGVGVSLVSFASGLALVGLVVALSTVHLASRIARSEGG
ncbi:MAG: hypothetical protein V5A24_03915 [Haloarculaceae archaeon]